MPPKVIVQHVRKNIVGDAVAAAPIGKIPPHDLSEWLLIFCGYRLAGRDAATSRQLAYAYLFARDICNECGRTVPPGESGPWQWKAATNVLLSAMSDTGLDGGKPNAEVHRLARLAEECIGTKALDKTTPDDPRASGAESARKPEWMLCLARAVEIAPVGLSVTEFRQWLWIAALSLLRRHSEKDAQRYAWRDVIDCSDINAAMHRESGRTLTDVISAIKERRKQTAADVGVPERGINDPDHEDMLRSIWKLKPKV